MEEGQGCISDYPFGMQETLVFKLKKGGNHKDVYFTEPRMGNAVDSRVELEL